MATQNQRDSPVRGGLVSYRPWGVPCRPLRPATEKRPLQSLQWPGVQLPQRLLGSAGTWGGRGGLRPGQTFCCLSHGPRPQNQCPGQGPGEPRTERRKVLEGQAEERRRAAGKVKNQRKIWQRGSGLAGKTEWKHLEDRKQNTCAVVDGLERRKQQEGSIHHPSLMSLAFGGAPASGLIASSSERRKQKQREVNK